MQKRISLLMVLILIFLSAGNAFAYADFSQDNMDSSFYVYDETINDYAKIAVVEINDSGSRVQATDSDNNIIYDYTYNIAENYFYNNLTNEKEILEHGIIEGDLTLDLEGDNFNILSGDVPRFCTGPRSSDFSISVKAVTGGAIIGTALIATKLAASIAAFVGVTVTKVNTVITFSLGLVAGDIYGAITGGDWGQAVHLTQHFDCTYQCSFDPFEGNICFYGYSLSGISYRGTY